jgi:pSer/pThr/pTyr-binding forkhead associated (FHA) protein
MKDLHPENVPLPVNGPEDLRPASPPSRRRNGRGPLLGPADRSREADSGQAPAGRALPVLRLLSLDARPRDFLLAVGENTVGRHPDNDVVIPSRYVSRRHCAILVSADGGCFIQDLGSRGGVHVEGERMGHPLELREGDVIRLGDQLLVLLSSPNGAAQTGPGQPPRSPC